MQRGKRKSPFVGGSQPLDGGILYGRYTDLSAVLIDGEEVPAAATPPAACPLDSKKDRKSEKRQKRQAEAADGLADAGPGSAAAANGHAAASAVEATTPGPQKQRKKARWTDEQKEAAKAEREAAAAARKAARKSLAGGGDAAVAAAAAEATLAGEGEAVQAAVPAAGPGAEAAPPADTAGEAPPADSEKSSKKKKKKDAAVQAKLAPEERVSGPSNAEEAHRMRQALGFATTAVPEVRPPPSAGKVAFSFRFAGGAAEPAAPAAAAAAAAKADSSSDEDSSSSEEEEEAAAIAAKKAASSSSGSDSSSEDEDSSDEEDGSALAAAAAAAAAKGSGAAPAVSSDSDSDSDSSSSDDEGPAGQAAAQQAGEFVPLRVYVGGMPYGYSESQLWEYWGECGEIESLDLMTFPDTGRFRGIVFITYKTDEGYQAALACNGEQCDGQTLKVMKCRPSPKDRQAAQQAQQAQQQQAPAQYAPPARYEASPAMPAAPQQQAAVQQEERPPYQQRRVEGEEGGTAAGPPKKLYAGPAPKTPGYHVAYVGNVAYEADDKALSRLFEPCGVTKVRLHTDKDTGKPKGFAHVHFQEEAGLDQAVALDGTNLLGRRIRVGYAQPKRE